MADLSNPLDQLVVGQAQPAVTANELFDAVSPAAVYGRRAETSNLLTWGYFGGRVDSTAVAHGIVALTASNTNYIVASKATAAVSVSTATTNWNDSTNYIRLYLVTTDGTAATNWEDHRQVLGASASTGGGGTVDTETIQDVVGAMVQAGSNISVVYDDASSPATLTISGSAGSSLTEETVQDITASLITAGSGIGLQYNDGDSPATLVISATNPGFTTEEVQDIVGSLLVAGTNTTIFYDDAGSPPTITVSATGGSNDFYEQATAPTGVAGRRWHDTDTGILYTYSGDQSAWVEF